MADVMYARASFQAGYVVIDADSEAVEALRCLGLPPSWSIRTTEGYRLYLRALEALQPEGEHTRRRDDPCNAFRAGTGQSPCRGVLCEVVDLSPLEWAPSWLARWAAHRSRPLTTWAELLTLV